MTWPTVNLGDVADVVMGQSPPGDTYNENGEGLPFFQGKADFGKRFPAVRKWCMAPMKVAEPGDILLSVRAPVGPTNIAREKSCIGRGLATIRGNPIRVDQNYLRLYLQHRQQTLALKGRGSTFPAIGRADIETLSVPLPGLSRQRQVAGILDQADHVRQLRSEANAKLERVLPALFLKTFGDPTTNPMNWPVRPLGRTAEVLSGGAFPRGDQGRTEGELPFIKVSDMNLEGNEWFINRANNFVSADTLSRLRVRPAPAGTTVFPKIGAAIGTNKKRLLVRPTAFDNNVIGVTPCDPAFSSYLFGFFQLFDLRRLSRATAVPSIRASELSALPVPKPTLAAASLFAAQFGRLTEIRAEADQGRQAIEDLFNVLAYRAFRGHLTVAPVAGPGTAAVRVGATSRRQSPAVAISEGRHGV